MKTNSDGAGTPNERSAAQKTPSSKLSTDLYSRTVHHDGNQYFATAEMAEIFRSHAAEIAEQGHTELVPLLHSQGVELLLVSPRTVFAVVTIEVGRAS